MKLNNRTFERKEKEKEDEDEEVDKAEDDERTNRK